MKELKLILLMLTLGVMLFSCQEEETEEINVNLPTSAIYQSASGKGQGNKCLRSFELSCLGGKKLIIQPGEIQESLDVINYCNQKIADGTITCSFNECTDRLDILYGFRLPPVKGDRCISPNLQ